MIWVTWRQHRSEAWTLLGVILALAVFAAILGSAMRTALSHDGITACLSRGGGGACGEAVNGFISRYGGWTNQGLLVLAFVPGIIGVMVGAPLLAREFEQGTWRLAWSQTVPRTRWLMSKLALVTGGLALAGAAATAVFTWYREPMDKITGHFTYAAFDFEGLALTSYLLCAFAFAVLAGLVLRRTTAAMTAALAAWVVLRGVVAFWLRPRLRPALTLQVSPSANIKYGPNMPVLINGHVQAGDWILGTRSTAGHQWLVYQPGSRFWEFQVMEAGLYLALTVIVLGAAVWLLRRRIT